MEKTSSPCTCLSLSGVPKDSEGLAIQCALMTDSAAKLHLMLSLSTSVACTACLQGSIQQLPEVKANEPTGRRSLDLKQEQELDSDKQHELVRVGGTGYTHTESSKGHELGEAFRAFHGLAHTMRLRRHGKVARAIGVWTGGSALLTSKAEYGFRCTCT